MNRDMIVHAVAGGAALTPAERARGAFWRGLLGGFVMTAILAPRLLRAP